MLLDTLYPRTYLRQVVHYDTPLPQQLLAHVQQAGFEEAFVQLTDGSAPLENGDYAQYAVLVTLTDLPALVADLETSGHEWLATVQSRADAEQAASVRAERNRRLQASDTYMLPDRQGLQAPEGGKTFAAWLTFLQGLAQMLSGAWAAYRQALRDLPRQEGFPWQVTWPKEPGEQEGDKANE